MKKKFLTLLLVVITSLCLIFGACGFSTDEGKTIASITPVTLDDGSIQIIITYTDDYYEPETFTIPKGEQGVPGEDGSGIASISVETDEITGNRTLIIQYEDTSMPSLEIPLHDGEDGRGIESITRKPYIDGSYYLEIVYTDGTTYTFDLESGKDGDKIEINPNPQYYADGNVYYIVTITHDDGSTEETNLKIPKGDRGNGIVDITGKTEGDGYVFTIVYDNEETKEVRFTRPNTWLTGVGSPAGSLGIDGDFYFDTLNYDIYLKDNGSWGDAMLNLKDDNTKRYTVSFELSFESYDAEDIHFTGNKTSYTLKYGTFAANGYSMPTASLVGYTFKGWYSTREPDFTVNAPFTDMTLVSSDITLYPIFEANAE